MRERLKRVVLKSVEALLACCVINQLRSFDAFRCA
jgi:hypothetical protein